MFKKRKINVDYVDEILNSKIVNHLKTCPIEKIYAVFLRKDENKSSGYSPMTFFEYGHGNETSIFKETYNYGIIPELYANLKADAVIMLHNHPVVNGRVIKAYPSKDDIKSTIQTGEIWQREGCFLLDHIIINEFEYYSFTENNLIKVAL